MAEEGYFYESRCVCKLCNKKFPCGKSLGAHMRSHVVVPPPTSSAESDEKTQPLDDFVQESDSRINYGLRENPKKTWRAEIHSRIPSPPPPPPSQGRVCKQCGKWFQSMKALCGHMACHSEKERNVRDDGSWTSENQKAAIDYSSDSEEAERNRMRTRSSASRNKRYKKFVEKSPLVLLNNDRNVLSAYNGSSSVSEIDGQDQEEVAMCLMLLSRDFVNSNNNNNSVVESSDNNSVILETNKSSSIEKRIGSSKGKKNTSEDGSDSDSGYFLDECAKAESGLSVDGFRRYTASFFGELRNGSNKDRAHDNQFRDESRKYECYNCKKAFKSYQALGGHRPCHKRTAGAIYEPRYESGENSLDDSTDYNMKKLSSKKNKATATAATTATTNNNKSKSHVCPFCDRVFKNGQALGGHKRSHFIGGRNLENRIQTRPKGRDLLDLNLPAPEADGY